MSARWRLRDVLLVVGPALAVLCVALAGAAVGVGLDLTRRAGRAVHR